ncbi:MAG: hypothetical protein Q8P24_18910 [Desulfobacterales bacterium]|nr:hypothetical protein [Desulfobacterales bacterium]
MEQPADSKWNLSAWGVIFLLILGILLKGLFAFFMVGNPGQPSWDYRPVQDVPGQSPYAIYRKLPDPQHIRGKGGQ